MWDQTHSVFIPGLTHRGPVYNATSPGFDGFGAPYNAPSFGATYNHSFLNYNRRPVRNRPFTKLDGLFDRTRFYNDPIVNRPFSGVVNRAFAGLGDISTSQYLQYGLMAGLLYLGYKKQIPGGMLGGAVASAALYFAFSGSSASAAPVVSTTPPTIVTPTMDTSNLPIPTVGIPSS